MSEEIARQTTIIDNGETREGLSLHISGEGSASGKDATRGLSAADVEERRAKGLVNGQMPSTSKSVGEIIRSNTLTPFYFLNAALAVAIILFGSLKNVTFIGAVICNVVIGIVQELRAKRTLDKLSLITAPKVTVIRDGLSMELHSDELVQDDVMELSLGHQVCTDCLIIDGSCEVDESMLTGEADPVTKNEGDELLSGSFIVSGRCLARVTHVGMDNYAAQLSAKAKSMKKPVSEMMAAIDKLIKTIAIGIAPVGILLFLKQYFLLKTTSVEAVNSTVAACIGMIPEGLVLLTSVVLAVGIIRLARHGALIQELYSIEMLARVDTLCLDKTGTLTSGKMSVAAVVGDDAARVAGIICHGLEDNTPTGKAILEYVKEPETVEIIEKIPFSSTRKWSGLRDGKRSYICGAAQFILRDEPEKLAEIMPRIELYAGEGLRVLLVAASSQGFTYEDDEPQIPKDLSLLGLIAIRDEIRTSAPETMDYFRSQGVDIKIISGDDPATVSRIAARCHVPGAEKWVDMSLEPMAPAGEYVVFGRVTPEQKLQLVKELRSQGHTVAMMGDGVNDVMALKESDCSIAPAAGSDAAKHVSQVVLMESDFACLPKAVAEGRRSINNLQRSAALFLTKTIFAAIVSLIFLFLPVKYPLEPIQISLISIFTIGAPSFVLALETNKDLVKGHFLRNVLSKSLPGSIADIFAVVAASVLLSETYSSDEVSAISAFLMALVGFMVLIRVSWPFDGLRLSLFVLMLGGYVGAAMAFPNFLSLIRPDWYILKALIPLAILTVICYVLVLTIWNKLEDRREKQS